MFPTGDHSLRRAVQYHAAVNYIARMLTLSYGPLRVYMRSDIAHMILDHTREQNLSEDQITDMLFSVCVALDIYDSRGGGRPSVGCYRWEKRLA